MKKRKPFGVKVHFDGSPLQYIVSDEVLKVSQTGITHEIEKERDIYRRERLRVIREEIKLIRRTVY